MQDLVQDLASLARKILARFVYFSQDSFYWFPVKMVLQEISKFCKYFSCKTCKILHSILHISCKCCTKNEAFLARYKKSCKNLARKNCKIIFLQDIIKILQDNYLAKFSCKIFLQDACNIFHILQEKLHS